MNKFIKIKNHLINTDIVKDFILDLDEIWVYFTNDKDPSVITCYDEHEARLIFEDIPHLIDNNYIPDFVRECNTQPPDYSYDELPFQDGPCADFFCF